MVKLTAHQLHVMNRYQQHCNILDKRVTEKNTSLLLSADHDCNLRESIKIITSQITNMEN
jgi:hypothetical protein